MQQPYTVQRFRGGFAIVWTDADGKRRRYGLDAADRQSAQAAARRFWRSAVERPLRTVGEIVDAYLADRAEHGAASINRMRQGWRSLSKFWKDIDYTLIDDALCRQYAATRKVAPATIRTEMILIASALNAAARRGCISSAPKIWRPRAPERREGHLTRAQFAKLLDSCCTPHIRLFMIVAITTGARPRAILDLEWRQIDLENRRINLNPFGRTQTAKRRPILPINDPLAEALTLAQAGAQTPYVIEWAGDKVGSIKKGFASAAARAGIDAHPYILRHSAAVWMAEQSVPMAEIAQFLGHTNSRITERVYARYSPEFLQGAARALTWKGSNEPAIKTHKKS